MLKTCKKPARKTLLLFLQTDQTDIKDAEVQLGSRNVHKCASALQGFAYDLTLGALVCVL